MTGCVLAMVYFIFKLVRMYQPSQESKYSFTRRFLTFFAALSLLVVTFTLINSLVCFVNFDKGLKPHISMRSSQNQSIPMNATSGDRKMSAE